MEFILENTTDSIWAINNKYQLIYLNKSFRYDFGKTFGTQLNRGDVILDYLPVEIVSFWKEKYDNALEGKRFSFENSFLDQNGKMVYVEVSFSPILENNKTIGVTCFGRDITHIKQNEIDLKKYMLLLKSNLESQKATTLLSIDKNYRYMYFNRAHSDAMKYAYSMEIEVGMNILDCITNEKDRHAAKENYSRALSGESHSNIRVYGDQHEEFFESFFNPIYNDEHEIIGATAMARNISDRIRKEEQLKKTENELREANITKDKFFSLIAHDLRSPIGSISSLTRLLYEGFDKFEPVKQKELLSWLCDTTDNTYSLLEDLLLWSQSQNDQIVIKPEHFNISKTVDDIIKIFGQLIVNKSLKIIPNYNPSINLNADKQMISTIIRNLLANAIKFSYKGGTILVDILPDEKGYVKISITDFGVGIPDDKIERIFNIGVNISTTGTNNEKGTGLGLIMCKEFVDKHNGSIIIESKIHEGTKVTVTLPNDI